MIDFQMKYLKATTYVESSYLVRWKKLSYLMKTLNMAFCTAQKMKFSIKEFFSKFDQIHSFLQIWLHLLKKSLMENFIFCAVL